MVATLGYYLPTFGPTKDENIEHAFSNPLNYDSMDLENIIENATTRKSKEKKRIPHYKRAGYAFLILTLVGVALTGTASGMHLLHGRTFAMWAIPGGLGLISLGCFQKKKDLEGTVDYYDNALRALPIKIKLAWLREDRTSFLTQETIKPDSGDD